MKLVLIGHTLILKLDIQLDLKHFTMEDCVTEAKHVADKLGFSGYYIEDDEVEIK